MRLDKQHPVPVYLQLKEMLQRQIEQGFYYSHQKLPSERDLCQHHDLSRMTARRALQELIEEGLAYTKVGKGTFVSDRQNGHSNGYGKNSFRADQDFPNLIDAFSGQECHLKVIEQLLNFKANAFEQTVNQILASYSLEMVTMKLFPQVIRHLEEMWWQGEIDLLAQKYALTAIRCQLTAMVNATNPAKPGPKVLLGCAPGDQHEMGVLLLGLSLRRCGFEVIYLGPNVPIAKFHQVIERVQPQLICFSAATTPSAQALAEFSQDLYRQSTLTAIKDKVVGSSTLFTFGGVAFTEEPRLISSVSGVYLGSTIETAVRKIENLIKE